MWNSRRDLVARRGFHPRKVDGVPGNTGQPDVTLRKDEQRLSLRGYKSIREAEIEFGSMNFLIGATVAERAEGSPW